MNEVEMDPTYQSDSDHDFVDHDAERFEADNGGMWNCFEIYLY